MANQKQKPTKNLSPSTSSARMRNDLGYDEGCVYAGQPYSHGSIVDQAGQRMRCSSGTWVPARKADTKKPAVATNKGTK